MSKRFQHLAYVANLTLAAQDELMKAGEEEAVGVVGATSAGGDGDGWTRAEALLREAVQAQLSWHYSEPPSWHYPIRQCLGEVLMRSGR